MPCTLDSIRPFDVLIASVEFEDKPGVAKPRPVVVLEVDGGTLYVTAVKVTSHAPREWCSGEVVLVDWEREGLAKPSVARCSKIMRFTNRQHTSLHRNTHPERPRRDYIWA